MELRDFVSSFTFLHITITDTDDLMAMVIFQFSLNENLYSAWNTKSSFKPKLNFWNVYPKCKKADA